MNGTFQVAQASGTGTSSTNLAPRIYKLTKPLTDQAVVVNVGYEQKVLVDFSAIANEKITLVHVGEKLIILFDNQSTVTVEPFFDSRNDPLQNITIEMAPGRDISVTEFASLFPITTDTSTLPASDNGGYSNANAQASGAFFTTTEVQPLFTGNPLDLLGNEDLGTFVITQPTGFVLAPFVPEETPPAGPTISAGLGQPLEVGESFIPGNSLFAPSLLAFSAIRAGLTESNSDTENFASSFSFSAPAGVKSVTYALNLVGGSGVDTGLVDTGTGNHLFLFVENGQIVAREGLTLALATNGPIDATLAVNAAGDVTFTAFRSVHEFTLSDTVLEGISLNGHLVSLVATVTDINGNTASASIDLGPLITIHDDVPTLRNGSTSGAVDEGNLTAVTDNYGSGNDSGPTTTGGSLLGVVRFGADGPHQTAGVNDGFQFTVATGDVIVGVTSHGLVLHAELGVTPGVLNAVDSAGHAVFTLTIDESNGSWTFQQFAPIDHPTGNGENTKTLDLSGLVQAVDGDGDSVTLGTGQLTVTITDDIPLAVSGHGTTLSVDEGGLATDAIHTVGNDPGFATTSTSAAGALNAMVNFGADGPDGAGGAVVNGSTAAFQFVSVANANTILTGLNLFTEDGLGGQVQVTTATISGGTLKAFAGSIEVFDVTLNANGSWTFTDLAPIVHVAGGGENNTPLNGPIDLSGLVLAVDFDGDTAPLGANSLLVTITDDIPLAVSGHGTSLSVDEGGLATDAIGTVGNDPGFATTSTSAAGALNAMVNFGADGPDGAGGAVVNGSTAAFQFVSVANANTILTGLNLFTEDGLGGQVQVTTATISGGTLKAFAGSIEVFDVTLNANGSWTFTDLAPIVHVAGGGENNTPLNGPIDLSGLVLAVDFDGDTAPLGANSLLVTITDDIPLAVSGHGTTLSVDEGGLATDAIGTVGNDPGFATTSTSAAGALNAMVNFGADGPDGAGGAVVNGSTAAFQFVSVANANTILTGLNLFTEDGLGGQVQVTTATISGGTLKAFAGSIEVFDVTLNANGSWTFTDLAPIVHVAGGGENNTPLNGPIDLSALVLAVDFDGDTAPLGANSLLVTITDDIPLAVSGHGTSLSVDEGGLATDAIGTVGNDPGFATTSTSAAGALNAMVNFGADGPDGAGGAVVNGSTAAFQFVSVANANTILTGLNLFTEDGLGGQVQVTTATISGGTLKAFAGSIEVFDVTLNANGSWTFTDLAPIVHVAGGGENNTPLNGPIDLSALVLAVDFDGDTAPLGANSLLVTITDDIPLAVSGHGTSLSVDEGGLATDAIGTVGNDPGFATTSTSAAGALNAMVNFGADGPDGAGGAVVNGSTAAFQFVSVANANTILTGLNLFTEDGLGGQVQVTTATISGGTLKAFAGSIEVFDVTLNANGSWTFTDLAPIVHVAGGGENNTPLNGPIDLSGLVLAVDFDGDTAPLGANSLLVTITDDIPLAVSGHGTTLSVDEGGLATDAIHTVGNDPGFATTSTSAAGALNAMVNFGADGPDGAGGAVVNGSTAAFQFVSVANANTILTGLNLFTEDGLGGKVQVTTATISGGTLKAFAGSIEVFDVTLNANGSWTFTDLAPIVHVAGGGENNTPLNGPIDLSGLVLAVDFDGDTAPLGANSLLVTITDDIPLAVSGHGTTLSVDEGGLATDAIHTVGNDPGFATTSTSAAGALNAMVNFGADGPDGAGGAVVNGSTAAFQFVSVANANTILTGLNLFTEDGSGGKVQVTTATISGGTLKAFAGSIEVFDVTLNANGSWTFTDLAPIVHVAGGGENNTPLNGPIDLSALVLAVDFDGDTAPLGANSLLVTITDDIPLAVSGHGTTLSVDEGGLATDAIHTVGNDPGFATTSTSAAGALNAMVNFGADGPDGAGGAVVNGSTAAFQFVSVANANTILTGLNLFTEDGLGGKVQVTTATISGGTLKAFAGSIEVFDVTLNANGSWTFTDLAPIVHVAGGGENTAPLNGPIDLSGLVLAVDFDGDTAPLGANSLLVTITDDIPLAVSGHGTTLSVDEGGLATDAIHTVGNDPGFATTSTSAAGALNAMVNFGADGPDGAGGAVVNGSTAAFQFVSVANANTILTGLNLFTEDGLGGKVQVTTATISGGTLKAFAGSIEVFDVTLNANGSWTFTDLAPIVHVAGGGENTAPLNGPIDLSGLVLAVDFDGDTAPLGANSLLVTITDDIPLAVSGHGTTLSVDEGGLATDAIHTVGNDPGFATTSTSAAGALNAMVNFGADGPDGAGGAVVNGSTAAFQFVSVANANTILTGLNLFTEDGSGGKVQVTTATISGGTLKAFAGSIEVFDVTLNANGSWTFTDLAPIVHVAGGGENNTPLNGPIDLSALVLAVDFDGDTAPLGANSLLVTITDDIPLAVSGHGTTLSVDEGGLATDAIHTVGNDPGFATTSTSAAGALNAMVNFGADGPDGAGGAVVNGSTAAFQFVSVANANTILTGLNLFTEDGSGGKVQVTTATISGGTLKAFAGSIEVFDVTLNANGSWTFTDLAPIVHVAGGGENNTPLNGPIDLSGLVLAVDFDGDTAPLGANSLLVTITDDIPLAVSGHGTTLSVDEGGLATDAIHTVGNDPGFATTSTSAAGALNAMVNFGADGPDGAGGAVVNGSTAAFQFVSVANANTILTGLNLFTEDGLGGKVQVTTATISGGTLKAFAGSIEVFDVTLNANGSWTFTDLAPIVHVAGGGENNTPLNGPIDLSGLVLAVDFDGDTAPLGANSLLVTITDDIPLAVSGHGTTLSVDEGGLATDAIHTVGNDPGFATTSTSAAGALNAMVNFGADGPDGAGGAVVNGSTAAFQFVSVANANTILTGLNLFTEDGSGGKVQVTTATISGGTLKAFAGSIEVFDVTLNANGSWTFTDLAPIVHVAGGGENNTPLNGPIDLSGLVLAVDFDGDTAPLGANSLLVTITDDIPLAVSGHGTTLSVDEGGLATDAIHTVGNDPGFATTSTSAAGALNAMVNFGADGPDGAGGAVVNGSTAAFQFVSVANANTILTGLNLFTEDGLGGKVQVTTATISGGTLKAFAGSIEVFDVTLNANGSWTFTDLAPIVHVAGGGENNTPLNGPIDLSGLVLAVDFDGDTAPLGANSLLVTITDDIPLAVSGHGTTLSVDEGGLATDAIHTVGNDPGFATTSTSAAGALNAMVNFGADGPDGAGGAVVNGSTAAFQFVSVANANTILTGLNLFTEDGLGGKVQVTTATISGGTLKAFAGSIEVFDVTLNANGSWTFTDLAPIVHVAGGGENTAPLNGPIDLSGLVLAVDFDGDTVPLGANSLLVTITDDIPLFGEIDSGFVPNTSGATIIGNMTINPGADGFGTPAASLFGDTPPAGLLANGQPVNYFVDALDPATLIAYTGADHTTNHVFTLVLDPTHDTYTFTLDQPLQLPSTSTTFAFSNAGGPVPFSIISDTGGSGQLSVVSGWDATASFTAAERALWLSGATVDPGTNASHDITLHSVNASTNGIGVANNGFEAGEFLRFDFSHPETTFANGYGTPVFSGPNVNSVTIGFNQQWSSSDTIQYVIHQTDGSGTPIASVVSNDAFHPTANGTLTFTAASGDFIDWIDIYDLSGAGKVLLDNISTVTNTGTTNLVFPVTTTDGDGDHASSSISVQVNGSGTITGTTGNDVIAGAANESLTGNGGSDTFEFSNPLSSPATITDFNTANDTLSVSAAGFGGGLTAGEVFNGTQVQNAANNLFTNSGERFLFDSANHTLYYSADGTTGNEHAVAILNLVAAINPTNIHVAA